MLFVNVCYLPKISETGGFVSVLCRWKELLFPSREVGDVET